MVVGTQNLYSHAFDIRKRLVSGCDIGILSQWSSHSVDVFRERADPSEFLSYRALWLSSVLLIILIIAGTDGIYLAFGNSMRKRQLQVLLEVHRVRPMKWSDEMLLLIAKLWHNVACTLLVPFGTKAFIGMTSAILMHVIES